jgi:ABC-type transport system involved in multi-copper enzyme maturation permease subunit
MAKVILRRVQLDWPLLGKELLEQAARKQMYVIRVVYAFLLFGAFCVYYARQLAEGPVLVLGGGLGPFNFLVAAQLITIYLFLPPMMAGALAQEKERETLGLLFLTNLTPWELILQKYIGRLIPMLTLLFLSLPLLAVAYSLGGVSAYMLYSSATSLFLSCLWVGAVALECSAHEATTFQALVRCWGICLGFAMCCTLGPLPFWFMLPMGMGPYSSRTAFLVPTIFNATLFLVMTWLFLLRAKFILESRAFVPRRNPFGHQFKQLDQYWKDVRKLVHALLRTRNPEICADAEQVVRRGLGKLGDQREWSVGGYLMARMQIPNLLAAAIIVGAIVLIFLVANVVLDPKSGGGFYFVINGLWILALLTVPIQSANAVASERINERLAAILTTPLPARDILDEWLGPVQRWIQFLRRPLAVIFVVEAIIKFLAPDSNVSRWTNVFQYLAISLLTIWIYPALVQWCCFWLGLRIRNQVRALMTSLLMIVAWCVLPLAASSYLIQTGLLPAEWSDPLRFVSPITVIRTAELFGNLNLTNDMLFPISVHLGLAAVLMWMARRVCLTRADQYLGRV